MLEFTNLDQSLIGLSKLLLKEGVARSTRGFDCIELPYPVMVKIKNPKDRLVTIKERKWNPTLAFAESLWIASGLNRMDMVGDYVKNMYSFSDDGEFMRASYGPRIRGHFGVKTDYRYDDLYNRKFQNEISLGHTDQLKFVIDKLKADPNSRQAAITIHDPAKDNFESDGSLKQTKDTPCCRTIQFLIVDGKLDCIVQFRSNDLIWGYSAVNVFNFTFMQEYVSLILDIPIGSYYHIANNLHFYSDKKDMVEAIAKRDESEFSENRNIFKYHDINTLDYFDYLIEGLYPTEREMRAQKFPKDDFFIHNFFQDWYVAFNNHWAKKKNDLLVKEFNNDYLNKYLVWK